MLNVKDLSSTAKVETFLKMRVECQVTSEQNSVCVPEKEINTWKTLKHGTYKYFLQ